MAPDEIVKSVFLMAGVLVLGFEPRLAVHRRQQFSREGVLGRFLPCGPRQRGLKVPPKGSVGPSAQVPVPIMTRYSWRVVVGPP